MCFNIVTLDMFLIFNFWPIIFGRTFLNIESAEKEENNMTNQVRFIWGVEGSVTKLNLYINFNLLEQVDRIGSHEISVYNF